MTPCHVDSPSDSEISQARDASLEHANFYMHQADMIREMLLDEDRDKEIFTALVHGSLTAQRSLPYINPYGDSQADRMMVLEHESEWLTATQEASKAILGRRWRRAAIEKDQIKHRKVDIQRLIKTFAEQGKFDMIKPLLDVDFTKPLEPQIGYDPDKY